MWIKIWSSAQEQEIFLSGNIRCKKGIVGTDTDSERGYKQDRPRKAPEKGTVFGVETLKYTSLVTGAPLKPHSYAKRDNRNREYDFFVR